MLATIKTHAGHKVYDANGQEWRYIRWVDTETGEAEQIVVDESGAIQVNETRTGVLTRIVMLPAPVLLVPIKREPSIAY